MHVNRWSRTGIVSYGAYVPFYRITVEEIAKAHKTNPKTYQQGLKVIEKVVPAKDEDTITISVNAARQALSRLSVNHPLAEGQSHHNIGAIYIGSESHPYAVKPSSVTVGQALDIGHNWTAADLEFACKAGTAGMQMVCGLVDAQRIEYGLAIGADTAQGAPGDALEYTAASAAAAFIFGKEKAIARLIHTTSFSSDTPDFWRREHQTYPKHGGRFTGQPAYFKHICSATELLLEQTKTQVEDYKYVVFHMPNGKFPRLAAKRLGVTMEQLSTGLIVTHVGNPYSASSPLGLAAVLDVAQPGEKILMTSYGSGAGSDSFAFEITEDIQKYRAGLQRNLYDYTVQQQIEHKQYLSYAQYIQHTKKI